MKKLIIFGIKDLAELAWYYFTTDSAYEVVAFAVSKEYLPEKKVFHELPIIDIKNIEKEYSPEAYDFFVPMTPREMNKKRKMIYQLIKEKGYNLATYISSKAKVFDNLRIGENCFVLEGSVIQPFVEIGNDVIIWNGHVGHHSVLKEHIFMTKAILCGHTLVENYCFIGVGAAVAECVTLAEGTFIAMNAAVIMNTQPWSVYHGNPAMKQRKSSLQIR